MDSWIIQICKIKKIEMDRDIEKEGKSRETAAQDSRKRLWHARDVFFWGGGGQGDFAVSLDRDGNLLFR